MGHSCDSTDIRTARAISPAANDRFTGQRQVQEAPADLEGQRVLQGVAVDDESHIIFLAQQIPEVSAVLSDGCSCCLKQEQREKHGFAHCIKRESESHIVA
ncbi:hypothetical protein H920_05219 [Fukomys damarensis]|uniref:Uncharacterized protein n=1 Tax=Fukomys damarensis TaxID=885580 RepID=A0A091EDA0_FUKDA|nr:hypothetical protein H920_05219 [Fukomys damarensis]